MALPQIGTMIMQAAIGQSTTLLVAQLGGLAVASSAAAAAATQVFTGALSPTLTAVGGIRVGYYLGQGEPTRASKAGVLALGLGAAASGLVAAVLLPLGYTAMGAITSDTAVRALSAWILAPVMLNIVGGVAVQVGTGGVLTSQGRPRLVALLSFGFELPFSLGSIAVLVLYFKVRSLVLVYWVQAGVTCLEAVVVWAIVYRSDWHKHSEEAQERQEASQSPMQEMLTSPLQGARDMSPAPSPKQTMV